MGALAEGGLAFYPPLYSYPCISLPFIFQGLVLLKRSSSLWEQACKL